VQVIERLGWVGDRGLAREKERGTGAERRPNNGAVTATPGVRQELDVALGATGSEGRGLDEGAASRGEAGEGVTMLVESPSKARIGGLGEIFDVHVLAEKAPAVEPPRARGAYPEACREDGLGEELAEPEIGVIRLRAVVGLAGAVVEVDDEDAGPIGVDASEGVLASEVTEEEGGVVEVTLFAPPAPILASGEVVPDPLGRGRQGVGPPDVEALSAETGVPGPEEGEEFGPVCGCLEEHSRSTGNDSRRARA
jgi:hypothetical protein